MYAFATYARFYRVAARNRRLRDVTCTMLSLSRTSWYNWKGRLQFSVGFQHSRGPPRKIPGRRRTCTTCSSNCRGSTISCKFRYPSWGKIRRIIKEMFDFVYGDAHGVVGQRYLGASMNNNTREQVKSFIIMLGGIVHDEVEQVSGFAAQRLS